MASYTEEDNKVKMSQEERDKLMKEFLEKGGKIKELKPGIAKGAASMNRSKGLQWTEKEVIQQEHSENFIPSLKNFTSIDSFNCETFEYHHIPISARTCRHDC